jgi:outer membrane protein assembly complex protein YaeT
MRFAVPGRRRVIRFAASVFALSILFLLFLHTGVARRRVLALVEAAAKRNLKIVLTAEALDYNLLFSRFEVRNLSVRSADMPEASAPLRIRRAAIRLPVWRLLRGSFETAQVRIDGLSVELLIDKNGRHAWPAIETGKGGAPARGGPSILVADIVVHLEDQRNGLLLHLPGGHLSATWDAARSEYVIAGEASGGVFGWKESRLPLDRLQLNSAVTAAGFLVQSLRLSSGVSKARLCGLLSVSPSPSLSAAANLDADLSDLSRTLQLRTPIEGGLHLRLVGRGPPDSMRIQAILRSEQLAGRGIRLSRPASEASFDTGTGELEIRALSAGLFSGKMHGNGRIRAAGQGGRSEFKVMFDAVDGRQLARALGAAGVPAGRAGLQVAASWPGAEWRQATLSAALRWLSAKVWVKAKADPHYLRGSLRSSLPGDAEVEGNIGIALADRSVSGTLHGQIGTLAQLGAGLERAFGRPAGSFTGTGVDGAVRWTATVGGTIGRPAASVAAQASHVSLGRWRDFDLTLDAGYEPGRIAIRHASLNWRGQEMTATGEIGGLSAEAPVRLEARLDRVALPPLLEGVANAPVTAGVMSGDVSIAGTLAQPSAEAALAADGLSVFGQRLSRAALDARWRNGELTVNRFTADQQNRPGDDGHVEAKGSFNVGTGRYEIEASGKDFRPDAVRLPGGLPLAGLFRFKTNASGALDKPAFDVEIAGSDVAVGERAVGELRAQASAAAGRATVRLTAPALNIDAGSTVVMNGAWPFEFFLNARRTPLDAPGGTQLDASVLASGAAAPIEALHAEAGIEGLRLTAGGQNIVAKGPVKLSYRDGRIRVTQLALTSGPSFLEAEGEAPLAGASGPASVAVRGKLVLDSLAKLLPSAHAFEPGGEVDLNVVVGGAAGNWQPSGSVTIRDGHIRFQQLPFAFSQIAGRLELADGLLGLDSLAAKAGDAVLRIDGSAPVEMLSSAFPPNPANVGRPARFSAELERFQVSRRSGAEAVTATAAAKMTGEASAFSLEGLRASVEFSELRVQAKDLDLKQTAPTRLSLAGGVATLERLDMKSARSSLRISGSIGLTGKSPVKFDLAGQGDLAALAPLAAPLDMAGALRADLHVGGTLAAPQTSGLIELDRGGFSLPVPPLSAASVKLRAALEGDRVVVRELSGLLNGGVLSGGGELTLGDGGVRRVDLFITGKNIAAEYPAAMKTVSSVSLKLASRKQGLILEGNIDVQEGYYDSYFDLFSRAPRGLQGTVQDTAKSSDAGQVALDVKLATKRPVEMDNNLGRLSATADLRLAGTLSRPRLLGALRLEQDGRLYFGDRTYYIERGTVRLPDAAYLKPELDIHAYTRAGDYTVRLGLVGGLNDLTTTFTSDPPLSRDDVISVLLTGKTTAENRGVDVRALEAYSLASGALNASISSRLHRSVGVSRVSIQPAAIAAESNPGTRVTITQDFTQALRLVYSMNLSDSNDQIWVTEYDLSRHFTTRAVKQSDNTYRGEFRHDIRFGPTSFAPEIAERAPKPRISAVRFAGAGPLPADKLAKVFKVRAGQRYNVVKVRKGSERVAAFLTKQGYLESRVHIDREDDGGGIRLTAQMELGPVVDLTFTGAQVSGKQAERVREAWRAGLSDQQRLQSVRAATRGRLSLEGYLQATADSHVLNPAPGRKRVEFDLKPGPRYKGVKTVIEGAPRDRSKELAALIRQQHLQEAVYTDARRLTETLTRFYQQRGYLAARIAPPVYKLDEQRRTGRIVIPVTEGRVYRVGAVRFSGNSALTTDALLAVVPLRTGVLFEPARLEPAVTAVRQKYGSMGFREARVDYGIDRNDERALVDVSFAVVEHKQTIIGAVKVEGARRTSEKFARSQLLVAEGKPANAALVRESVTNLSRTGAYASVDAQMRLPSGAASGDSGREIADLVVSVAEPRPFRLQYGGLYDTGAGPGFITDFENHNWFGGGRVLGLRTRYDSETQEARVYVSQPTWRRRRVSTTISGYLTVDRTAQQVGATNTIGASVQQDWQLRSKFLLSYGYRYELQKNFIPEPGAPIVPTRRVAVAPLLLTFSRDSRDSFLDATRGSFISHGFEYAPAILGSDYPYVRYYFQYFKYFPLIRPRPVPYGETAPKSRLVFATGSRLGIQTGFNPTGIVPTDRFFAGGGTTVRGFEQDSLGPVGPHGQAVGGNAVIVLNEELRYPLFWIFDAVSFFDAGNVYRRASDLSLSDMRTAAGFGLRIRNPFVVLRLDYGLKLSRRPGETLGAFFFSIGQAF